MKDKIPLEQFSVLISKSEKDQLAQLGESRGKSVEEMISQAVKAYLFAMRSQRRKKISAKIKEKANEK